jgi:Zn-dependent peptidase ImmA (M78 family)
MAVRVEVASPMLNWAMERSGRAPDELVSQFPKLPEWQEGGRAPTIKQLEEFARATRTPLGYLLLSEPPAEEVPLPDFRTVQGSAVRRPSPDLLDTIALCQERQDWYRTFARSVGQPPLAFVGALTTSLSPAAAADRIRDAVKFGPDERSQHSTWTDALRAFVLAVEEIGVLVMISGVVGSNTHRGLDPEEFRGFALVDDLAPVIFVNGADTKAAQIFTLAHELAHLWLGQSALDNPRLGQRPTEQTERWCNEVAAELLVPASSLHVEFASDEPLDIEAARLARRYRVSSLVILHSLYDARLINWEAFNAAYADALDRIDDARTGTGGDFYRSQPVRVSRRFARAVITSAMEGETLYRDAYKLLGLRKHETFEQLRDHMGVA